MKKIEERVESLIVMNNLVTDHEFNYNVTESAVYIWKNRSIYLYIVEGENDYIINIENRKLMIFANDLGFKKNTIYRETEEEVIEVLDRLMGDNYAS